jgi:RNA polymerase sigma factor (sigma-70 family)
VSSLPAQTQTLGGAAFVLRGAAAHSRGASLGDQVKALQPEYRAGMQGGSEQSAAGAPPTGTGVGGQRSRWSAGSLTSIAALNEAATASAVGDEQAFAALRERLVPGVRAVLLERTGKRHDLADDLTQRTMLGLWQTLRAGRYDASRSAVTTFTYAIAHKVWLQHARADSRRVAAIARYTLGTVLPSQEAQGTTSAAAPSELDEAALLERVRGALADDGAGLTEDERWLLRNWAGGISDRDLGKRMGIAASNVNGRKQVAYRKLRAWLEGMGFGKP